VGKTVKGTVRSDAEWVPVEKEDLHSISWTPIVLIPVAAAYAWTRAVLK